METSGFFNALNTDGVYDRTYNADHYSDNLAVVISDGVLRSTDDDLKVTASGLVVTVGIGRGWIKGHWYKNDTERVFTATVPPVSGTRYDRIMLQFDNTLNNRRISLVYRTGTAAVSPTKPAPVRTGDIYELVLADIFTQSGVNTLTITDQRGDADLCGWVYSTAGDNSFFTSLDNEFNTWFSDVRTELASTTLFKQYKWRTVLAAQASSVTFDIPQYDSTGVDIIQVYVNGLLETEGVDYTLSGSTITFSTGGGGLGIKTAGTEIVVLCYKSIDGEGLGTVSDEITTLQGQVSALESVQEYEYVCTGTADNVAISNLALAFLNGTGDYAGIPDDAQLTIKVYGSMGITAAFQGSGTSDEPYRWFVLGDTSLMAKRLFVDFSACEKIDIQMATGTTNTIFHGGDVRIIGANLNATCYAAGCNVSIFRARSGILYARDCRFKCITTGTVEIARTGTFIDCEAYISTSSTHAQAFILMSEARPLIIIGGTYRAYTASQMSTNLATVIYSASNQPSAACVLQGVNMPTVAVQYMYQKNAILITSGNLTSSGLITTLPISTTGATASMTGTIALSKP